MTILNKITNFIKYKIKNPYQEAFKILDTYNLKANSKIIDLGAHKGIISEYFLKKGCEVYAYEPNPHIFKYLCRLKLKYEKFNCYNLGIHSKRGKFSFYFKKIENSDKVKLDSEGNSLIIDKHNISKKNSIKAHCITLQHIISKTGKVDLIKVDIEGSEYEIFRDLIKFSDDFDNCIIETHYKKLSDKYIHLHQEMLKTIENHPNKLKFKLNYI